MSMTRNVPGMVAVKDKVIVFQENHVLVAWAGRRGLMDSTLGSGDRVRGFKSRSQ